MVSLLHAHSTANQVEHRSGRSVGRLDRLEFQGGPDPRMSSAPGSRLAGPSTGGVRAPSSRGPASGVLPFERKTRIGTTQRCGISHRSMRGACSTRRARPSCSQLFTTMLGSIDRAPAALPGSGDPRPGSAPQRAHNDDLSQGLALVRIAGREEHLVRAGPRTPRSPRYARQRDRPGRPPDRTGAHLT